MTRGTIDRAVALLFGVIVVLRMLSVAENEFDQGLSLAVLIILAVCVSAWAAAEKK